MTKAPVDVVDALGVVRSQISELRVREAQLEDELKARGAGSHEGLLFRATVSVFEKSTVAWKAIAAKLKPSPQLVSGNTSSTTVTKIVVTAKLAVKLAA